MEHLLPTAPTFNLARSLDFVAAFPPCQGDFALERPGRRSGPLDHSYEGSGSAVAGRDTLLGVFAVGGRAVPYRVAQPAPGTLVVRTEDPAVVPLVAAFLGTGDQLAGFYRRAAGDVAAYRTIVRELRGLHHVRFRTLAEVTVHAVLGQRTPIALASAMKRRVAVALGPSAEVAGRRLHAFPTFEQLLPLSADDWHAILGHRAKADRLPGVIRGVAGLGEPCLRTVPYAVALAALESLDGVGPFTAAMILLRGLGRMDDVPLDSPGIATVAESVYGPAWNPARIRARYGTDLGYWAYYLKAGATRTRRSLAS